jgi:hypothetical protein
MSLKRSKGDAKLASNHMIELGMDFMKMDQIHIWIHQRTCLLCNMWSDQDA